MGRQARNFRARARNFWADAQHAPNGALKGTLNDPFGALYKQPTGNGQKLHLMGPLKASLMTLSGTLQATHWQRPKTGTCPLQALYNHSTCTVQGGYDTPICGHPMTAPLNHLSRLGYRISNGILGGRQLNECQLISRGQLLPLVRRDVRDKLDLWLFVSVVPY